MICAQYDTPARSKLVDTHIGTTHAKYSGTGIAHNPDVGRRAR